MKVTDPDDPLLVIAATLLWRWEHDKGKGKRTKMRLSPRNRRRWYAVKDLVEESWTVESTTEVTQIARRILDILELPEDVEIPDWLEEVLEVQVVPHEYRGRYSYRQEQRTPDTPNLACIQVGYRVPSSAWGIVVDRSGSISTMLKPLQQGLMAVHLALEELALPHRIAAFEGNALLKDFGDTSPVPRALIAGLQGMTTFRVMPTPRPTFEALTARPEEVKVLLLLHDGLAHDPEELGGLVYREEGLDIEGSVEPVTLPALGWCVRAMSGCTPKRAIAEGLMAIATEGARP